MKSLPGLAVSKSFRIPDLGSYAQVAAEYYDPVLHPTCADFRNASSLYLRRLFAKQPINGRVADVGCGRSLLAELGINDLVLVDASIEMLEQNPRSYASREVNVLLDPFGENEFDWVFAILADPYNELDAWLHISRAMKADSKCVFIVPSFLWVSKFRSYTVSEKPGCAKFDLLDGSSVYLRSVVLPQFEQERLINSAGLSLLSTDHVLFKELKSTLSMKTKGVLAPNDPILDIYFVGKA